MSKAPGHNPLRWKCDESGCYNKILRPKIEVFAEDLPGKIAFSDIDAVTEVGGNFLFIEWKTGFPSLPVGQKIMFERLTSLSPRFTVIAIAGDAETMECRKLCVISRGTVGPWVGTSLDDIHVRIQGWAKKARRSSDMGDDTLLANPLVSDDDKAALLTARAEYARGEGKRYLTLRMEILGSLKRRAAA